MKEHKSFHFEVKAVDDEQGLIEAYGSVFGNIDQGNDVVDRGAFKRTIQNSKSRVQSGKSNFLAMMLWNHDAQNFLPIGGWYDLVENENGLLGKGRIAIDTQLGRDVYKLIKGGFINEFSIGYEVMSGGAHYDKHTGARHLTELRLWEVSPVVWAMNDEALLVGVKSMDFENKSVCGSTSGPIGPRDESWDGSAAKSWIWSQALDDEGNVKPAVAKRYFMRLDGDPKLKGSYSYPFWTQGHISVGGVKAVANALAGARNADAGGDTAGMRRKVETLYRKINSKYADATPLVPPWKDGDGKSTSHNWAHKDLQDHFEEHMAEDLCEDWPEVYLCSLTCAVFDAIKDGSDPETDVAKALDDFKTLVMTKFMPVAMECDFGSYLEDNYTSSDQYPYGGDDDSPSYGYMSRRQRLARKELLAADATTGGFYANDGSPSGDGAPTTSAKSLVGKINQIAEKAMKTITEHVDQVHNAADTVTTLLGGPDQLTPTEKALPFAKAGRSFSTANAQALSDHVDTLHDLADSHQKAMNRQMKALQNVADDLADILQGSEAAYGTDPGTPEPGRQEGKSSDTSYGHTRVSVSRSSDASDTVDETEIATSLQMFKALRTPA
jgi:HK97 family phage prohead protease